MTDLAPGMYEAEIQDMRLGKSGKKGTPRVEVTVRVSGRDFQIDMYLSEGAIGMTRTRLRRIGFDPDARTLSDIDADPYLLRGKVCTVELFEEEWQGAWKLKADIPLKRGIKPDEAAQLTAALRAKKSDNETPIEEPKDAPATPSQGASSQKGIDYDDIPF